MAKAVLSPKQIPYPPEVGEEVIQVMFTFKKVIPLNQCSYT